MELDTENGKNRSTITSHSTHGSDAEKSKDAPGQNFTGILDRFLNDPQYRETQERIRWTEAKCEEMDKSAKEDHTYLLTKAEFMRYSSIWCLQLNKSGNNGPMATRADYRCSSRIEKSLVQKFGRLSVANPTTR